MPIFSANLLRNALILITLIFVFDVSYVSFNKPIVGNNFLFVLFAKQLHETGLLTFRLGNEIYSATFHSTLYVQLLSIFYDFFDYGISQTRLFNYTTIFLAL